MTQASGFTFELISILRSEHEAAEVVRDVPQFNSDLHFVHTISGSATLYARGRTFQAGPDVVLAVPIYERCMWRKKAGRDWRMINFHCRASTSAGMPVHHAVELPFRFSPANLRDIHKQLAHALDVQWRRPSDIAGRCAAGATVAGIFASYLAQFGRPAQPRAADELMMQLRQRIEREAALPFDAETLAAELHLSVSQMNRRYRAAFGLAPKAFRQQQRLALAENLLRDTDEKLADVAETLGFSDVAHFARWFRQQMGAPPGAYRRQSRTMQA